MKHITKPSLTLFLVASISTLLLSVVYAVTLEPISQQNEKVHNNAMRMVLTKADEFAEIPFEATGDIVKIFEGTTNGERVGYVFEMNPAGYSGNIDVMLGISSVDDKVSSLRVVRHTETPGLGALAVKEDFYKKFEGKELTELKVVRVPSRENADEIHAITSATITTKAITDAVNEAIEWYNVNK